MGSLSTWRLPQRQHQGREEENVHGGLGAMGLPQASRQQVPDTELAAYFNMYTAIVSSKYPNKARELWVYQTIMIGEAGLSTMQHLDSRYPPTNL